MSPQVPQRALGDLESMSSHSSPSRGHAVMRFDETSVLAALHAVAETDKGRNGSNGSREPVRGARQECKTNRSKRRCSIKAAPWPVRMPSQYRRERRQVLDGGERRGQDRSRVGQRPEAASGHSFGARSPRKLSTAGPGQRDEVGRSRSRWIGYAGVSA